MVFVYDLPLPHKVFSQYWQLYTCPEQIRKIFNQNTITKGQILQVKTHASTPALFTFILFRDMSNFLFTLDILMIYNSKNIQLSVSEMLYWWIESFESICRNSASSSFPLWIIWRCETFIVKYTKENLVNHVSRDKKKSDLFCFVPHVCLKNN